LGGLGLSGGFYQGARKLPGRVGDISERKQARTQRRAGLWPTPTGVEPRNCATADGGAGPNKQQHQPAAEAVASHAGAVAPPLASNLQAQEEERKQISRELHDEIAQTLVGINVHLAALTREAAGKPATLQHQIARTQQLVEKSVDSVHRFARELRPTMLDDLGLIPALHAYLKEFTKRTGIHVHFKTLASGKIKQLNNATRTVFYRVAQEALTNVARHAQASLVEVSLEKLPGALCLNIKDNGKSFQVKRVLHPKRNTRLGLIGMRERLEMVGGTCKIVSTPGRHDHPGADSGRHHAAARA
jgi:signal transduction histidine kinase